MEKGLRALFYEYKYYLLPTELTLDEVKKSGSLTLTRMKEELCMAPDFIYESMQEETVVIDVPEHAFEVTVNLYTHEEYDELLGKLVDRICHDCTRYEDTGTPDLNGHHREMALCGSCYERRLKGDPWSNERIIEWFWYKVSLLLDDLSVCIDKNNQKKLNKLLEELTKKVSYPIRYYGAVHNGKYCLCMSSERAYSPDYANILSYLAAVANLEKGEMHEAGWEIYPYFPKDVFVYEGKKSYKDDAPTLYLVPLETPNRYAVYIYHVHPEKLSEKKKDALIDETYDRIRAMIGEDQELALVAGYTFGTEREKAHSIVEVCEELSRIYAESNSDEGELEGTEKIRAFPRMYQYGMNEPMPKEEALPYKEYVLSGLTSGCEFSFLERKEAAEAHWWHEFCTYAYLVFPVEGDATELMNVVGWYITNADKVPEPLRNPDDHGLTAMTIGFGETEESVFIDNLVFDEQLFFRTLRFMAPVLRTYRAKIVTVNGDGIMSYLCDYEFTPEEG